MTILSQTKPLWFFCRQGENTAASHCGKGMVFAVNCGADGAPNSFTNFKDAALAIGAQLTNRLLRTSRQVSRMAFMDVTNRISRTLLDLCEEPDAMTHPDGTQIRISRQEVSRIVGCSREMVGRVLKQLEEQGMIDVAGKTIVVRGTR